MSSLLIRNLQTIVTCDDGDQILRQSDLYAQDGVIRAIGPQLPNGPIRSSMAPTMSVTPAW